MTHQTIIRSACYLCEQPIEFPAELANQIIPCPHCGKEIKLLAASRPRPRWRMWIGLQAWNSKQKALTLFAGIGFFVTLFNAHWEVTTRSSSDAVQTAHIEEGSVFKPPPCYYGDVTGSRLLLIPLAFRWVAILAVYFPLLFFLRAREQPLLSQKVRRRIKVALVVTGVSILSLGSVVSIAVLIKLYVEKSTQPQKGSRMTEKGLKKPFDDSDFKPVTNETIESLLGPAPKPTLP